jgi:hypothetical protein
LVPDLGFGRFAHMIAIALALAAAADPAAIQGFSQIPAINRVADGQRGIWVADIRGRWFYARFIQPCFRLGDSTNIGFNTSPIDRLDKDSAIVADGEVCRFATFERSEPPPKRTRR